MNRLLVFLFICFGFSIQSSAQTDTLKNWRLYPAKLKSSENIAKRSGDSTKTPELDYNQPDGKLRIEGNDQIDLLNAEIAEEGTFYGYTVQLAVSQQQQIIKDAKYKMLKLDPKIDWEAPYKEPNVYLYAGRFYDRNSAYAYKKSVQKYFPSAIVIGPKKLPLPTIEMPKSEEIINETPDNNQ